MASSIDPRTEAGGVVTAHRWEWTMACGVVMLLAGIFSLAAPGATTVAIAVTLAWVLLIVGIAGIVIGIRSRSVHRRWVDILYGVASLLIGLFILLDPLAGALSLALAFALWLAFRGTIDLAGARQVGPGSLRGSLIAIGIANWVVALILFIFPLAAVALIGVIVGLSLLLGGAVTMFAAWQLRRIVAA